MPETRIECLKCALQIESDASTAICTAEIFYAYVTGKVAPAELQALMDEFELDKDMTFFGLETDHA